MKRNVQRILLVEPEPVVAEVTAFRLELLGYSVETVVNPVEALRKAKEISPDLIITDLTLQEGDATGFIESLSNQEDCMDVPILVLSVDADLDRVAAVHRAGAADFLLIPFPPEVLGTKVASLLARPRRHKELPAR